MISESAKSIALTYPPYSISLPDKVEDRSGSSVRSERCSPAVFCPFCLRTETAGRQEVVILDPAHAGTSGSHLALEYEARIAVVPPLHLSFVWLAHNNPSNDLFVPLDSLAALNRARPIPRAELDRLVAERLSVAVKQSAELPRQGPGS